MTRISFGVMGGFLVGHSGSGKPPQDIPGQWTCSGKNGCGPRKFVACGAEIREIMIHVLMVRSLVQLEGLRKGRQPQTRLSAPSVTLPQQSPAEGVGANSAVPWAPGVRVDLVRELLKNILSSDDYAKYSAQLEPPKREDPTIYQDLANKFKEHGRS